MIGKQQKLKEGLLLGEGDSSGQASHSFMAFSLRACRIWCHVRQLKLIETHSFYRTHRGQSLGQPQQLESEEENPRKERCR